MKRDWTSDPVTITVPNFPALSCLIAVIWAQSPETQAFDTTIGVFLFPKNPAILSAEFPSRSLSAGSPPQGSAPLSSSSTLPFVEDSTNNTSSEAGSVSVPFKAFDTDRIIRFSKRVRPSSPAYSPILADESIPAYSSAKESSSINEAKNGSGRFFEDP